MRKKVADVSFLNPNQALIDVLRVDDQKQLSSFHVNPLGPLPISIVYESIHWALRNLSSLFLLVLWHWYSEENTSFHISLPSLQLSHLHSSLPFSLKKKVLNHLHTIQQLSSVSTAKSHGDWLSAAQFIALLSSINSQGKAWNNFSYLLPAAPFQWRWMCSFIAGAYAFFNACLKMKF